MFRADSLDDALGALGALIADAGARVEIVAIGGGALLLLGLSVRPTRDCDVVAVIDDRGLRRGHPLPEVLLAAARDVADRRSLSADWINAGPASLVDFGLPIGFLDRALRRDYGGLIVHLASRLDQIHLKVYAAADDHPGGKHAGDLRTLEPTRAELEQAAAWSRTHDPSEGFAMMVEQVVERLAPGARDE